jgi:predicted 3-demethylubiquinone-9 3-methyltransferase (glyoxalase superfamily)
MDEGGSDAGTPTRRDGMSRKQKITTYLWFDDNAEEAMSFYVSLFPDSRITSLTRYGDAGPGPKGTVMAGTFQLAGQEFMALNGGPHFTFTEAISLFVDCGSQEEVDRLWERLTADGGEPSQCGWLKDRFGLSWQIIPTVLLRMLSDEDPERSKRVTEAMLQMSRIDIDGLERAYRGDDAR